MECPNCGHTHDDCEIVKEAARINGRKKTEKSARASRENGKKGGRPRKHNDKVSGGAPND